MVERAHNVLLGNAREAAWEVYAVVVQKSMKREFQ